MTEQTRPSPDIARAPTPENAEPADTGPERIFLEEQAKVYTGPHFIGIGAQKAATTWLFKMLSMHPDVYFPRGKEVAYWNGNFDKREHINSYLDAFRKGAGAAFGGKNGDITPLYMLIPDEDIALMRELLPDVKLLFVARNPVERAISGADFHMRFHGDKVASYDQLLIGRFVTNCGLYHHHIERWMKYFPREQLHVIVQDDIRADARKVLTGLGEYLDLDPAIWQQIPAQFLSQQANKASYKTAIRPMQRARLQEKYREDVEGLSNFLGRDLTHWVR